MGLIHAELRPQRHDESGPEQGQVEAFAVVRGAGPERRELLAKRVYELRLGAEIVQEMLPQHERSVAEVRGAKKEYIRAGATHQSGGLRVEEDDVLPARGGGALQTKVRDHARVRIALAHHGEAKVRELDPLLAHLNAHLGRRGAGWPRRPSGLERQGIQARAQLSHPSCPSSSATPTFTFAPSA